MKIIAIFLIILVIAGFIWGRIAEKREWNNGVCKKSGRKWRYFDTDSQGGKGYTDDRGNYLWI